MYNLLKWAANVWCGAGHVRTVSVRDPDTTCCKVGHGASRGDGVSQRLQLYRDQAPNYCASTQSKASSHASRAHYTWTHKLLAELSLMVCARLPPPLNDTASLVDLVHPFRGL